MYTSYGLQVIVPPDCQQKKKKCIEDSFYNYFCTFLPVPSYSKLIGPFRMRTRY
jgi:hypothetical protein